MIGICGLIGRYVYTIQCQFYAGLSPNLLILPTVFANRESATDLFCLLGVMGQTFVHVRSSIALHISLSNYFPSAVLCTFRFKRAECPFTLPGKGIEDQQYLPSPKMFFMIEKHLVCYDTRSTKIFVTNVK